jgi:hypothetical protein
MQMQMQSGKRQSTVRLLKPTQKLLRNYMSSSSPYRSLIIYHEMGVGKTCTAITIAEELKKIVKDSNKKIYVLRWAEIDRQLFDINAIEKGEPLNQCTGDSYLQDNEQFGVLGTDGGSGDEQTFQQMAELCADGVKGKCETLKAKVDKVVRKTYKFLGTKSWARDVKKLVDSKTRNISDSAEKTRRIKQILCDMFNNSLIIIDEAHELRSNNKLVAKLVPPVLEMVLKNTTNLRLILLTATPIYDKPQNILSLINYCLLNDKRPKLNESDVFDAVGNLKSSGKEILIENTRGYISFLRGSNPFDFPIRISARYNIPNQMLDLTKYPTKDIYGNQLPKDDKIKYLDLVNCPLKGPHKAVLLYHIKNDTIPDLTEVEIDELSDASNDSSFDSPPSDIDTPGNIAKLDELKDKYGDDDGDGKDSNGDGKDSKKSINIRADIGANIPKDRDPAYQMDLQISNFIYQSLEEAHNNIKLTYGNQGLNQVASLIPGKRKAYTFNTANYAKRFFLPELKNWGGKIAAAVESAIKSKGPVFIYTFFNAAGVIPLAFALEMNGFRRYRQGGSPLLESNLKDTTYRGDYIIYSGDASISQYAKTYLDMGKNMINEKNVKVFIGTEKASEGLNLFGYREVHIIDPWHNINKIEQSIGRAIRTGSHLHLPPQERNVTVYQYATTFEDRESIDLKVYRICETKAIKSGKVEKILKENAFDCNLNYAENVYNAEHFSKLVPIITSKGIHTKVSLVDQPYSRACSYMKDCAFKCIGSSDDSSNESTPKSTPLMKFNYEKDIEEYRNLILELMKTSMNVKIENLRRYLKKYIYDLDEDDLDGKIGHKIGYTIDDEDIFNGAIRDIINQEFTVKDRMGRLGHIVVAGDYLRFIPVGESDPNMSIERQHMKPAKTLKQIDLKAYITRIKDEHKKLMSEEKFNYYDIVNKYIIEKSETIHYGIAKEMKFNIKPKIEEIISIIFEKLIYGYKLTVLRTILDKIIKGVKLTENEARITHCTAKHIVYMTDIFPEKKTEIITMVFKPRQQIYGFVIQNNNNKLELYSALPEGSFEHNSGNIGKYRENRHAQLNKYSANKLYGYLKYEKHNAEPTFKITDLESKGDKKSVTGSTCLIKPVKDILKQIKQLDPKLIRMEKFQYTKTILCNDVEIMLRRNDEQKLGGHKWFYTAEDYFIYFGNN